MTAMKIVSRKQAVNTHFARLVFNLQFIVWDMGHQACFFLLLFSWLAETEENNLPGCLDEGLITFTF